MDKNNKNMKIFVAIFILFSIIGVIIYCINKDDKSFKDISESLSREELVNLYNGDNWWKIGYEVAKKNGDWSKLPLSNSFREKYNEKDGILKDIQFDYIEYRPYAGKDDINYYFKNDEKYFEITLGKKKTVYEYIIKSDDEVYVDDVLIFKTIPITNENGEEIIIVSNNLNNTPMSFIIDSLINGEEERVSISEKFKSNYKTFLDIFIHYSPIQFNRIIYKSQKSDPANNVFYFIVYSFLEDVQRHYKVSFYKDDKGYLDDVKVKLVGQYDGVRPEHLSIEHTYETIFYKNSKWNDNLMITQKLRDKYEKKGSVFPSIDYLDYNFFWTKDYYYSFPAKGGDEEAHQIIKFVYKDNSVHYFVKFISVIDELFDEIDYIELPYLNLSVDEVKKRYENEYGDKTVEEWLQEKGN